MSELKNKKYRIELSGLCRYKIIDNNQTENGYLNANIDYSDYTLDLSSNKKEVDSNIIKEFLSSLKGYFNSESIEADWKTIKEAPANLLIRSLAQSCPFNNEEKQMLLESKDINTLAETMIALFKISAAGEIMNIN